MKGGDLLMDIVARIFALMSEKNWSTYDLANHANLTQSTVSSLFRKQSLPTLKTLSAICEAFEMSLADFFGQKHIDNDDTIVSSFYKLSKKSQDVILYLLEKLD